MMAQELQQSMVKRRVSYFYDPDIGNYHYGQGHPMKVNLKFSLYYSTDCLIITVYSLIEFA
jgi:hypothetical protein